MQPMIERECVKCHRKTETTWKEFSRWLRNNPKRDADDYLCSPCSKGMRLYKHGGKGQPLYAHWKSMFVRTRGQGHPNNFKYYVAKGIKVCEEWRDYKNFRDWATKNGFKSGIHLELD